MIGPWDKTKQLQHVIICVKKKSTLTKQALAADKPGTWQLRSMLRMTNLGAMMKHQEDSHFLKCLTFKIPI
jgi:hypothetical protein